MNINQVHFDGLRPIVNLKMRVLHVFKTYLPDSFKGVERVIWQIAEGAKSLGVESEVFSLSKTDRFGPSTVGHHLAHTAKLDL